MRFRKVIFWLHLFCGVLAGIVVTIMSITGVALTYQRQMTARADRKLYMIQVPANASPLSVEALVNEFQKAKPEAHPVSVTLSSDSSAAAIVATDPNVQNLVNPYTGEFLGPGSQGIRDFFRLMTDWHRWLALSGESRGTGRALTGACNLAFLFIVASGLYLWWPRKWSLRVVRATAWFRGGLSAKARDSNWHYVFGFWCAVPLLFIVASGVVISYPWANNLLFRLAGSNPPVQSGPARGARGEPGNRDVPPAPLGLSDIDPLISRLQKETEAWKTITFRLPRVTDRTVTINVETSTGNQPQYRSTITLDKTTGTIVRAESFRDQDLGRRLRMWMRFVHTGEYYGLIGQTIAGIAAAASIVMVWTGFALSLRRFVAWRKPEQGVRNAV